MYQQSHYLHAIDSSVLVEYVPLLIQALLCKTKSDRAGVLDTVLRRNLAHEIPEV